MSVTTRNTTAQKSKVSKKKASNRECKSVACKAMRCQSVINSCKTMVAIDRLAEHLEERYQRTLDRLTQAVNDKKSNLFISKIIQELYPLSVALDTAQRKHANMKKSCVLGNPRGTLCTTRAFNGNSNAVGGRAKTSRLLARRSPRVKNAPKNVNSPNVNNRRKRILNAIAKRAKK